ncbi:MAG: type I methionyl aminopeptidase [Vicinamibacterales bacterium]
MSISTPVDLEGIRASGRAVAEALDAMRKAVVPGITTAELDAIGEAVLARRGARSAPRLVYDFPGCNCISVNEEIVHGIPRARRLAPGDVLKLDVTASLDGYIADAADTVIVPPVPAETERLRLSAEGAFYDALAVAAVGQRVNRIGLAVERRAKRDGFAVIRELCGHGVGRTIHEEPEVPNYFAPFQKDRLTEGLVITIEPLFAARPARAVQTGDGWTIATHNGATAVHYEHTLIVTSAGPEIVTSLN